MYLAPYFITICSLVKIDTTCSGKASTTIEPSNPPTTAILIINAIIDFIELVSSLPQYCEFKTIAPDASPKINVVKMKYGWFACEIPANCNSSIFPIINVSVTLTPTLIRFCIAMGIAINNNFFNKLFSLSLILTLSQIEFHYIFLINTLLHSTPPPFYSYTVIIYNNIWLSIIYLIIINFV